jgi:rhodanese-related sulfurtransferase
MGRFLPLLAAALSLAAGLAVGGCEPGKGTSLETDTQARMRFRKPEDRGKWLSPAQAAELIAKTPDIQLVCVGMAEDYRQGHLPGSMLMPVTGLRLAADSNSLYPAINRGRKLSRNKTQLVYCWWNDCKCPSVPTYSDLARQILREKGFTEVYSIEGGMKAWVAAGLAVEKNEPAASTTPPAKRPG